MIEAKMKELCIHDLYEKYPECDCRIKTNVYEFMKVIKNTYLFFSF